MGRIFSTIGILTVAHAACLVSYGQTDATAQPDQLYEALASKQEQLYMRLFTISTWTTIWVTMIPAFLIQARLCRVRPQTIS